MKNHTASKNQTIGHRLFIACITALSVAFTTSLPQPSYADYIEPPTVPTDIRVPAGNKLFLVGHAVGTQQYFCRFPGTTTPWVLFGPQATLFDDDDKQVITHFLSPNPLEGGKPRPTYPLSDSSLQLNRQTSGNHEWNGVIPPCIKKFLISDILEIGKYA